MKNYEFLKYAIRAHKQNLGSKMSCGITFFLIRERNNVLDMVSNGCEQIRRHLSRGPSPCLLSIQESILAARNFSCSSFFCVHSSPQSYPMAHWQKAFWTTTGVIASMIRRQLRYHYYRLLWKPSMPRPKPPILLNSNNGLCRCHSVSRLVLAQVWMSDAFTVIIPTWSWNKGPEIDPSFASTLVCSFPWIPTCDGIHIKGLNHIQVPISISRTSWYDTVWYLFDRIFRSISIPQWHPSVKNRLNRRQNE
jgi:hypothetical protein